MKAILKHKSTGVTVSVTATTDHPDAHNQAVWVDESNEAYCIVGHDHPFYDEVSVDIEDREGLGQYLHFRRVALGISYRKLAEMSGLTPSTVQNVENGAFTPRLDIILKMLGVLGKRLTIS